MKILIDKTKFMTELEKVLDKAMVIDINRLERILDQATIKPEEDREGCPHWSPALSGGLMCWKCSKEVYGEPTQEEKECKHKCCEMPCKCDCRNCDKPTPEPEECKCEIDCCKGCPECRKTKPCDRCVVFGVYKPKPKVPEKLNNIPYPETVEEIRKLRNVTNEIIDYLTYLKEKEDTK